MKILDFLFELFGISDNRNCVVKTDYSTARHQLADYLHKALQEVPDHYNIAQTSATGLVVDFVDATHAYVTVQKKHCQQNANPRNITFHWIPHLNKLLSNVRAEAEYQLEVVRTDTLNRLCALQNECAFYCDNDTWNLKSSEIVNAYFRYFYKIEHLLCGVNIIDYAENDGTFTFNVVIDNTVRVPIALA